MGKWWTETVNSLYKSLKTKCESNDGNEPLRIRGSCEIYRLREGPGIIAVVRALLLKWPWLPFRASEMQPSDIWKVGTPDTIWLDSDERDVRGLVICGWKECSPGRYKWKTSRPASACSAAEVSKCKKILWLIDPLLSSDCKQRPLLDNARNIYARYNRRTVNAVVRAAAVSGYGSVNTFPRQWTRTQQ
jgi:hypothetical protein